MSRFLSAALFLLVMYWSWQVVNQAPATPQELHVEIQDSLRQMISEYISENAPGATDLKFDSFWSEAINPTKIKASFRYSFFDQSANAGAARTSIEGFAVLNRIAETPDGTEWGIDELVIENNRVDYEEPMNVGPNEDAEPSAPEEP